MDAVILAAGLGTRLRPITDFLPKPLIPVFNVPLLDVAIFQLRRAGHFSFLVNAHHLAPQIEGQIQKWKAKGLEIQCNTEQPEILGTGGALVALAPRMKGGAFLVYNGDILSDIPFDHLVKEHQAGRNIVTMALRLGHNGKDLAIWLDKTSNMVVGIAKTRPDNWPNSTACTLACAYVAERVLLDFLPKEGPSSIVAAMTAALEQGFTIKGVIHNGFWADIGTPEALFDSSMKLVGMSVSGRNALLGGNCPPRVSPSAVVHPSAQIDENSIIGPYVTVGEGASLKSCVLFERAAVEAGVSLANSIIAAHGLVLPMGKSA